MKILFWGTPRTSVPFFEYLLSRQTVLGAVTKADKPADRGQKIHKSPVKMLAEEKSIPVLQPSNLKDGAFQSQVRELNPDAGIVVAYGKIIPPEILRLFPRGLYNLHFSLLPHLRGAAPIQWSIYRGDKVTGVTAFRISETLDTGNILARKEVPVDPRETAATLEDKLIPAGIEVLAETLEKIEKNEAGRPQTGDSVYAPLIKKENLKIDWSRSAEEIDRQVRAFLRLGAVCRLPGGKNLKITAAEPQDAAGHDEPGTVTAIVRPRGFVVRCGKGALLILKCQLEGKKEADAWSFLQGHPLKAGEKFS